MRDAIGSAADVEQFVRDVVNLSGGYVSEKSQAAAFHLPNKQPLIQAAGNRETFLARFSLPVSEQTLYLSRTHPLVEGLAGYVLNTALDPLEEGLARRASVIRTTGVQSRVTLLLLRYRFHILTRSRDRETPLLAEACQVVGYRGSGPLLNDLLGGQIPVAFDTLDTLLPQQDGGKLRILASSGNQRSPFAPNTPTFSEAGLNLAADGWNAFFAPAAMPAARAAQLSAAIAEVMKDPETQRRFNEAKLDPVSSTAAQTRAMLTAYRAQWAPVVQKSGFKP
jgi:hypothetical protein